MSADLPTPLTLAALARRFDGVVKTGDAQARVTRLASIERAQPGDLGFVASRAMRQRLANTRATAVLVTETLLDLIPEHVAAVVVQDAYATYAAVARWIASERAVRDTPSPGIHPTAVIDATASIDASAMIGAHCTVGAHAQVAAGVRIGAGCAIGREVRIGVGTELAMRVSVYDACEIGQRCLLHAGTVVGADGFGFAPERGRWSKIPQLGRVLIGDDVEIGANCAIDRGALDDTVIADGCKLDNLIQVGHNVRIGEHTAIAGCVGIAGSAVIGRRCRIGGKAGILGHLEICDDVTISAMSLVMSSIDRPGFYSGVFPLMENADWERAAAVLRRLPDLRQRLRHLEKQTGNLR